MSLIVAGSRKHVYREVKHQRLSQRKPACDATGRLRQQTCDPKRSGTTPKGVYAERQVERKKEVCHTVEQMDVIVGLKD